MNNTTLHSGSAIALVGVNTKLGLYVAFMVLGLLGNGILLAVIFRRKTSITVFETFIINLSIADVLLLIFHVPLKVYQLFIRIEANIVYCKIVSPLITALFCSEIFTITAMSLHRYWVIVHPFRPKPTTRTANISIVLIWLSSVVIVLPLTVVMKLHPSGDCYENWPSQQQSQAYTVSLCVLQYALPLTLITIAYIRIVTSLFQSRVPGRRSNKTYNVQVVKSTAVIVGMFTICILPGQIAWLMNDFGGKSINTEVLSALLESGNLASSLHTAIDPLVYGIFVKEYRQDYMDFLTCRKTTRPLLSRKRTTMEATHNSIEKGKIRNCRSAV